MQVITSLEQLRIGAKTAVALGNFDGIHVGHRVILEGAVEYAKENGILSVCYTFSNHPVNFFRTRSGKSGDGVKLICTEEQKLALLEEMGFDYVVNVEFNDYIADMRAKDFIYDILKGGLSAEAVFCGFNYSFGIRAEGNVEMLKEECDKLGIAVSAHDAVRIDGEIVSSTAIRKLISDGDMVTLQKYLGRYYSVSGTVVHGNHIGNRIGFPTMNISAPLRLALPPNGVYFTRAEIDGAKLPAISNIGTKPTVGEYAKSVETNIFDYEGDAYGKEVTVEFMLWERPERKFDSIEELKNRIAIDCQMAYEYHFEGKNI